MISPAKQAANTANARLSTGPRTAAGKRAVRRNAVTHGLYAETAPDTGEDAAAFSALREDLLARFAPEDGIERLLVSKLSGILWRQTRVAPAEHAVYERCAQKLADEAVAAGTDEADVAVDVPDLWGMAHSEGVYESPIGRINRYEAHLERQQARTLDTLLTLQALRTGEDARAAARATSTIKARAAAAAPPPEDEDAAFQRQFGFSLKDPDANTKAWDKARDLLSQYHAMVPEQGFTLDDFVGGGPNADGRVLVRSPRARAATPAEAAAPSAAPSAQQDSSKTADVGFVSAGPESVEAVSGAPAAGAGSPGPDHPGRPPRMTYEDVMKWNPPDPDAQPGLQIYPDGRLRYWRGPGLGAR